MRSFIHPSALLKHCFLKNVRHIHSKNWKPRTGIFMLNMGGPATLEEVEPFLTRLFTDKDIIPLPIQSKLGPIIAKRRAPSIREKYAEIGGGSPILKWTNKQGQLMTQLLDKIRPDSAPHKHYVGFRYAAPLTENTMDEMERDGVERIVAFSQYPQYSCSTSGSSLNTLYRYYVTKRSPAKLSFIDRWPIHPKLIECFADLTKKALDSIPSEERKKAVILFTAHALPMKAVSRGDPYPTEVAATVLGVMQKLNWSNPYRLVWQSKVGPVAWLSPQTDDAIKGYASKGKTAIVLVPISFVNEHIETLHELDIEYGKELAQKIGVHHFRRVPAPNDHPSFIECLADIVKTHLDKKEICSPQLLLRCPLCVKKSCEKTKNWLTNLCKEQS